MAPYGRSVTGGPWLSCQEKGHGRGRQTRWSESGEPGQIVVGRGQPRLCHHRQGDSRIEHQNRAGELRGDVVFPAPSHPKPTGTPGSYLPGTSGKGAGLEGFFGAHGAPHAQFIPLMFHTFKHRTTVVHRDEKSFAPAGDSHGSQRYRQRTPTVLHPPPGGLNCARPALQTISLKKSRKLSIFFD